MPSVNRPLPTRKSLGRGLSALLSDARAPVAAKSAPAAGGTRLPVTELHADRANPRRHFDEVKLEELAASIKQHGVLQPLLVRKDGRGYRIIAGERRFRAAQRVGLTELPVVITEASDADALEKALVENLQRDDLNPLEEARGYQELITLKKMTHEQVADRVGKDRSTVANALRLLQLPNEVKQLLVEGDLDMGHARALLGLSTPKEMVLLARDVVGDKLTVRETEGRVKDLRQAAGVGGKPGKAAAAARLSPGAKRLVEDLQRKLGTRVRLREKGGKGRLEIDFLSYEDLDRLVALMGR